MAKTRLAFTVLAGLWSADCGTPYTDDVVIDDPDPALVRLASHAHAAGALNVTEGLDLSDVQTQEDGEAALRKAMGDHVVEQNPDGTRASYWTGPWYEGNLAQGAADAAARGAGDGATVDVEPVEPAA